MKPHQHHALRERDVFTTACELDNPAEYLASIAVTDPALAERVRRLLDARNAADSLLDLPGVLRTEPQLGADSTRSPTSDSPFIDSTPYWSVSGQETAKHEPLGPVPGFEIETVLGRGGMSIVYKARQVALKRTVALKMMLAGVHATPHQRTRFRFEAEAVARLQHPNIVQIHEVGETTGFPYCALEYVEGGTLAEKLGGNRLPILGRRNAGRNTRPSDATRAQPQHHSSRSEASEHPVDR